GKAAARDWVEASPSPTTKTALSDEWAVVSARLSELSELSDSVDHAEQPVLLCNSCGTALSPKGKCPACDAAPKKRKQRAGVKKKAVQRTSPPKSSAAGTAPAKRKRKKTPTREAAGKSTNKQRSSEDDFWDLVD
ncbi:MAG: hypothetical protein ABGZ24_31120, partial [Fuerstiella sp.]